MIVNWKSLLNTLFIFPQEPQTAPFGSAELWPEWLADCGSTQLRAVPLDKVPIVDAKVSIALARQPDYNADEPDFGGGTDVDTGGAVAAVAEDGKVDLDKVILGKIRQKPVNLDWWISVVHQVIIWAGYGRHNKGDHGKGKGKAHSKGRWR